MKKNIMDAMSWLASELNPSNIEAATTQRDEILSNILDKDFANHFAILSDKILESANKTSIYICYIWKYNCDSYAMLSRDEESFEDFKQRVKSICPHAEGYHHRFSEFKEIW